MPEKAQSPKMFRVTLVKSAIGFSQRHKDTIRALGLHRLNQSRVHKDSPTLQGMLRKVTHLVVVEEQVEQ